MAARWEAAWFIFIRSFVPMFDTYCDIGLAIYCHVLGVTEWGLIIIIPVLCNFCTSLSAYIRRNKGEEGSSSVDGLAVPFLIWPQVDISIYQYIMPNPSGLLTITRYRPAE